MRERSSRLVCGAIAVVLSCGQAAAEERTVTAGLSMRFISGTFGSEQTTTLVYAPAMLKVDAGRFEVAGFFPYLTINDGTVALSQAGFIPTRGTVSTAPSSGMPSMDQRSGHMMMGARQPAGAGAAMVPGTTLTSQSGIGDIYAIVGYRVVDDALSGVQVTVSGRVKAPTASYSRGLGTGRVDIGAVATIRKRSTSGWTTVDAGFMKIGDPADVQLRDVAIWSIGGGRQVASRVYLLGSVAGNTSVIDGFDAPVEVAAGLGLRLRDGMSFTILPSVGLSSSSPSFALTAGFSAAIWSR